MPELPEIVWRAREIDQTLRGRRLVDAELLQPKCLNLPPDEFRRRLLGEEIRGAAYRGKWVITHLRDHMLLLSLGMGGELLLHAPDDPLPPKLQARFTLDNGERLSLHFWWFGYLHLVTPQELGEHKMVSRLGADPLAEDFTPQALGALLAGRRTRIKTLLLDQSLLAGIGNMYSHDILFRARLHPDRPANSLCQAEVSALWSGIHETLDQAIQLGGTHWEKGLHGQGGRFDMSHLVVGYKEGQPCPVCGSSISKIQTGSNASFVCLTCQPLDAGG